MTLRTGGPFPNFAAVAALSSSCCSLGSVVLTKFPSLWLQFRSNSKSVLIFFFNSELGTNNCYLGRNSLAKAGNNFVHSCERCFQKNKTFSPGALRPDPAQMLSLVLGGAKHLHLPLASVSFDSPGLAPRVEGCFWFVLFSIPELSCRSSQMRAMLWEMQQRTVGVDNYNNLRKNESNVKGIVCCQPPCGDCHSQCASSSLTQTFILLILGRHHYISFVPAFH